MLKMMKDSGKMWDAFRVVGDRLGVKVLRYTKVTGTRFQEYKKKFMQFGWFAAAILFCKVLNETSQLSLYMESDLVLIYQLISKIKETF